MLAVMKTAPGVGNVALCNIAAPKPALGHVLLAVRAAGICGTDFHIYHDEFPSRPPVVLGHEVAGAVVAVGDGVDSTIIGRRVTTADEQRLALAKTLGARAALRWPS